MTPFKRGDVVLVSFPFTDLTTTKMRPALVVSNDRFNRKSPDIILAAVTSQVPKDIGLDEFFLSPADLKDAGLPKPSIVRLSKLVTIDQRLIRKKLGTLSNQTLTFVTSALHSVLS